MNKKAKERAKFEDTVSITKAMAIVVSNNLKSTLFKFSQSFNEKITHNNFLFVRWPLIIG